MRFIKTGPTGGDETAPYSVTDYQAKTIVEFIHEVLGQNPQEWGYIEVKDEHTRIEYRYGKLLNEIPDAWQSREIGKVDAAGGWTRMDYFITAKRPYNYETTTTKKNNMTIQDIMIDDWVKVKYTQKPVKVKEIKQSCVYIEGNGYKYDEIESIPLTAEILEKNGFVSVGQEVYQWEDGNYYVWYEIDKCKLGIDQNNNTYFAENISPVLRLTVINLHELQHALQLCKIDKKIKL